MLAAAPSKVPFYIAGGLLVVWAVLLAAWGISHAEFPGSAGRARLVMLTSLLLVAATITAAVLTGGEEAEEHAAEAGAAPPATGRTLALAADTITESTDTLALELTPGDYVFFCSVAGHRQSGMQGTLTVE